MNEFPSIEQFEAWLKIMPPGNIIAKKWTCIDCPLAKWIFADFREPVSIELPGYWKTWFPKESALKELPKWANIFVKFIDAYNVGIDAKVTVEECLSVLEKTKLQIRGY